MTQMIRIGIVDDESASRNLISAHLDRYGSEHCIQFNVRTFTGGQELATGYRPDFDIIFLDIQMQDLDGLETAARIRQLDADVVLVFITNSTQYAIKGYAVDALSYLVKPVPYFAFSQELKRCIDKASRTEEAALMLPSGTSLARVALTDIRYIESIKHRVVVHGIDRSYTFTGTLKAFEAELAGKGFFRSNNCYLVNMRHVTGVDQTTCVMTGGARLQVSRPRKKAFLDALADHVGGRLA